MNLGQVTLTPTYVAVNCMPWAEEITSSSSYLNEVLLISEGCEHFLYLRHLLAFNANGPELLGTSLKFSVRNNTSRPGA